jgi:succinoglycan biosynthesis transport protein ExoP
MADHHDQIEGPDLHTLTGLLRRRWYAFVLVVLVPAAALGFSLAQEDKYTAETSVLFRDIAGTDVLASQDPAREAATNVELVSLETVDQRVKRKLGDRAVAGSVDVKQQGQSNVLTVEATDPSPRVAARTANAYAAEYVAFRRQAELRGIRAEEKFVRGELEAISSLARQGNRAQRLRRELRRLKFKGAGSSEAARVVSLAQPPSSRSSPKPVRNTLIGGVVGLFLAGIAALLFERLDPKLRTPKEAEAALERPILALVRRSRALARPVTEGVPSAAFDDFLALRSYLRYMGGNGDIRSVLVTSGAARDGKTTVAWYLASAAAAPGRKVLLIEGDLRDPTLATALGAAPQKGLADILAGTANFDDVVVEVAVRSSENGGLPARIVHVIFAGAEALTGAYPLDWERLGGAIQDLEQQYDLIVIDTAPIVSIPDAVPLLSHVGGVIVIGRLGNTRRAALARLREQLDTVQAPTVGIVVNSVGKEDAYGYGYGYRSGHRHKR